MMKVPAHLFTECYQQINPIDINSRQNDELNDGLATKTLGNTSESIVESNYNANNVWEYPMLCYNCGTFASPLWTTDANGYSLCNNCCYQRKRVSIDRPYTKTKRQTNPEVLKKCFNCQTDKTTLWRRNNEGERVCNSCGLYFKTHGYNRPPSMRKETIQTRRRKPKNIRSGNNNQPTPLANFNGFDPTSAPYYINTSTEAYKVPISLPNDALPLYSTVSNPPPPYCSSLAPITTPENYVNLENIQCSINNL